LFKFNGGTVPPTCTEAEIASALAIPNRLPVAPEPRSKASREAALRSGQPTRALSEIAAELGVSRQAAHTAERRGLRKIREEAERRLGRPPRDIDDVVAAFSARR
jgi:hypothetical protein